MIAYVTLFQQGDLTVQARKELLIEQRRQLLVKMKEMQNTLELLNCKIDSYEQCIVGIEKDLKRPED